MSKVKSTALRFASAKTDLVVAIFTLSATHAHKIYIFFIGLSVYAISVVSILLVVKTKISDSNMVEILNALKMG